MTKIALTRLLSLPFVLIGLLLSTEGGAQTPGAEVIAFKHLVYHNKPPRFLNSHKTAVFFSVPRTTKDPSLREDWKALAKEVHYGLKQMKIDAMAYYNIEDVFSGPDAIEAFAKQLVQRDIKYLLYVEVNRQENVSQEHFYRFTVVPFNKEETFIAQNANAWKVEGIGLKSTMDKMFNEIYRVELTQENYLIPDIPEFFDDVDIFKARRIESYAMDLKVEPLIVPRFQKLVLKDSSKTDEATLQEIRKFNKTIDQKNQKLEEIMSTYPLKYELVDYYTEQEVYNKGGQFVLLNLQTSGTTIKKLLDYKLNKGENIFATIKATEIGSTVRRLPADAVVSKYYVKHVFTKDIYTGLKWDADLTWEEALQNFIFNMKDILKIK